mmetsp:Transcript_5792/g.8102  ORF Transcript_5792/g.8102 Transcript_5792/m.8102 type:complete len:214 (+) Transcript_5792:343-984(+)
MKFLVTKKNAEFMINMVKKASTNKEVVLISEIHSTSLPTLVLEEEVVVMDTSTENRGKDLVLKFLWKSHWLTCTMERLSRWPTRNKFCAPSAEEVVLRTLMMFRLALFVEVLEPECSLNNWVLASLLRHRRLVTNVVEKERSSSPLVHSARDPRFQWMKTVSLSLWREACLMAILLSLNSTAMKHQKLFLVMSSSRLRLYHTRDSSVRATTST